MGLNVDLRVRATNRKPAMGNHTEINYEGLNKAGTGQEEVLKRKSNTRGRVVQRLNRAPRWFERGRGQKPGLQQIPRLRGFYPLPEPRLATRLRRRVVLLLIFTPNGLGFGSCQTTQWYATNFRYILSGQ